MLKIHFIVLLWKEHWKLWKEWSFKMQMKRNLKTISTMKILLKTLNHTVMVQFYLYGVFQLKKVEENMLLQYAGIQNIKIYLQSVTVLMISWNRVQDWYVVIQLKIRLGPSINIQLRQVLCVLTSILNIRLFLQLDVTMVQ